MPGFEIRWGVGMNDAAIREAMRPVFRQGLNIAEERLEDVGLPLDETKRAVFHKVLCGYPNYAETPTSKTVHFCCSMRELRRGVDVGLVGEIGAHEGAHLSRRQGVDFRTLGDWAVEEGWAYNLPLVSEHPLRAHNSKPDANVRRILELPKREVRALMNRFREVADEPLGAESAVLRRWERPYKDLALSRFEVVGVTTIAARLAAGDTYARSIHLPTRQILGIS